MPQPPTEPLDVAIKVVDGSSVNVQWVSPARTGGQPVLDYKIEWDTLPLDSEVQTLEVVAPLLNEIQLIDTSAPFIGEVQFVRFVGTASTQVSEVQSIQCDATGGVLTITAAGQTTAAIAWNASAAAVCTHQWQQRDRRVRLDGGATRRSACRRCPACRATTATSRAWRPTWSCWTVTTSRTSSPSCPACRPSTAAASASPSTTVIPCSCRTTPLTLTWTRCSSRCRRSVPAA
jgi:hypothetical protein